MSIYFTKPIPQRAIWGGKALREYFNFPRDFGDDIGQAWVFSAQSTNASPLMAMEGTEGELTLLDLWHRRPEIFNSRYDIFPFIVSLVAPIDDLSIQVHPNEAHARTLGYPMGKNEAWVFLSSPEGAGIIYGHNAKNEKELRQYIVKGEWDELVRHMAVHTGDTVYIPAGTLHALSKGNIVYEIQQSTDVTFRFYDYDRRDTNGNTRPLQLEKAIACLHYDNVYDMARPTPKNIEHKGFAETVCVSNDTFVVRRLACAGKCVLDYKGYQLATVISGEGSIQNKPIGMGDSFLIPAGESVSLIGEITLMTTAEE